MTEFEKSVQIYFYMDKYFHPWGWGCLIEGALNRGSPYKKRKRIPFRGHLFKGRIHKGENYRSITVFYKIVQFFSRQLV